MRGLPALTTSDGRAERLEVCKKITQSFFRGLTKGVKMKENKKKYAYWMRPSMVAEIEEMMPEANATSKGDFVCKAVDFYIGYLQQQKNINYLAPVLARLIKSEVRSVEKNICEMLFKVAVEQAINSNMIASVYDIGSNSLNALRDSCAKAVAETNGLITFEDAYDWQKGE